MRGLTSNFILFFYLLGFSCVHSQTNTVLTEELLFTDSELKGDILFIGGYHGVYNHNGELAIAKQRHDFTGFIPIDGRSDSGYVIVNHEQMLSDDILGDGGGMTVFTAYRDPIGGRWHAVDDPKGMYRNVDFSEVGGTMYNCGGFQTAWGTVMTAEETMLESNEAIYKGGMGIRDTSDFQISSFNGQSDQPRIEKYEDFAWMVEVDVVHAKAIRKNYNMGRYGHEGGALLPDGKTIILTDDHVGGFLFKFVAYQSYDLSKGQLFVYRQSDDAKSGTWIEMPMELDALIHASATAASLGGTLFNRTEWAVYNDGKVYITETGYDDSESVFQKQVANGAHLSKHLNALDMEDGQDDDRIYDYYGRILELDLSNGSLGVYLEGGAGEKQHLANPDGLALTKISGQPVLMINEDLNRFSHGRVPPGYNERINEIFCLDLSIAHPQIDDLVKLAVGPRGCETTGGRFTPDGSTYFVNVQHPKEVNTFPYNHDVTIAVRNIDEWIRVHVLGMETDHREVESKQITDRKQERTFDKKKSYMVFNSNGDLVLDGKSKKLDYYKLQRGTYQLVIDGRIEQLIVR